MGPSSIVTVKPDNAYLNTVPASINWNGIGILCTVSNGASLTYNVEITGDVTPSSSGNWNLHDTLFSLSASANGNLEFAVTGIRVNITSYSSGSVNLAVTKWP